MNEQEKTELLVRLDTRQEAMDLRLEQIEVKLSTSLCYTHAEKIRVLELITGTILLTAITTIVTATITALSKIIWRNIAS